GRDALSVGGGRIRDLLFQTIGNGGDALAEDVGAAPALGQGEQTVTHRFRQRPHQTVERAFIGVTNVRRRALRPAGNKAGEQGRRGGRGGGDKAAKGGNDACAGAGWGMGGGPQPPAAAVFPRQFRAGRGRQFDVVIPGGSGGAAPAAKQTIDGDL